jgi:O-antigen/teichoic acid export membrane protein
VFVLTERIIGLLYTDEYAGSVAVLRVLIWVLLLEFLNPFLTHTLFAKGQQMRSLQVAALGLMLNTSLTVWLVLRWGAVGAAWGTVLGGLVACCCYCMFAFSRTDLTMLLRMSARTAAAAAGCGMALVLIRNSHWITLFLVGVTVYGLLIYLLRVFTRADYFVLKQNLVASAEA